MATFESTNSSGETITITTVPAPPGLLEAGRKLMLEMYEDQKKEEAEREAEHRARSISGYVRGLLGRIVGKSS